MCRLIPCLLATALLMLPGAAEAYPKNRAWATINVCDTEGATNTVGVRAGMPGMAKADRMRMRFVLQYFDSGKERWRSLSPPSKWVSAGPARYRFAQRGFDFLEIADSPEGVSYRYRALVRFQWRKRVRARGRVRQRVVRRARRVTRGGLKGVPGGRPKGRSDAVCVVAGSAPRP